MGQIRWNDLAANLRSAIQDGTLRPGDKLPPETILAAEWQVCRMTAHRALSELQREGLVARRRRVGTVVLAPPGVTNGDDTVRPLAPAATKNVGLLFFHTNDFPQVEYVHGFRAGLPDDHHLLFCDSRNIPERESHYLQTLLGDADALCCYPTGDAETTRLLQQLAESGKPVVCLDRVPDGLTGSVHGIATDNYQSALDGMRFMTGRGHKRVAFLTTDRTISSVRERRDAFLTAMAEAGQTDAEENLIVTFARGAGYDFDAFALSVQSAIVGLRALPHPPTALFCLEDYFLAAALEACDALGLSVPGDMEILSFSDCPPLAARLTRTVHRISQQAFAMGQMAAQTLTRQLQGEEIPVQTVRVPAVFYPAAFAAAAASERSQL